MVLIERDMFVSEVVRLGNGKGVFIMNSLYWDDFEKRIYETTDCIKKNKVVPIRRVAVFVTNKCNFKCSYCNLHFNTKELSETDFDNVIRRYGDTAIIHITGGEPSLVKWLYPHIEKSKGIRFHLNSNCFLKPPKNIKRLKVSLDSNNEKYFNSLVWNNNAFRKVVKNIKYACEYTVTSITCVLTKENYKNTPEFMAWCRKEFPGLYAVFFSVYKGNDKRFLFNTDDANIFFKDIKPKLEKEMDKESLSLLRETIDEKCRLIKGIRFPENNIKTPCYLSMSERVIDWNNREYSCSHLFRDNIFCNNYRKDKKCIFGCNRRLIMFNEKVEKLLEVAK